jgi:FkbM family methyltransferase
MRTTLLVRLRQFLRRCGVDLLYVRPEIIDLIRQQRVDLVLDVGANVGQYASLLRAWGYRGRIVSCEPVSEPFQKLKARAEADPLWEVLNIGLGDQDATSSINVSANSLYSSVLDTTPELHSYDAGSKAVRSEQITLRRLDSLLPEVLGASTSVFLKIDTQGYERQVVEGAGSALGSLKGVQLELSETPMYAGEASFLHMTTIMASKGFRIGLIRPFAFDPRTRFLVQSDVVFVPEASHLAAF